MNSCLLIMEVGYTFTFIKKYKGTMKKLCGILILTLFSYVGPANGQSWCTPGATWWYDHWGYFGNQVGVVTVECAGDTIILGESAHKMNASATGWDYSTNMPYQYGMGSIITRSTIDELSYWDGAQWHLLFDLSAGVGSMWVLSGFIFNDRNVQVDAIGTMNIDGVELRYSVVTFDPPFQGFTEIATDTIIEHIGYKRLFIDPNRTVGLDGDVFDLRCYQDNDLYYNTQEDAGCDIETGWNEMRPHRPTALIPNPSSGPVTISALPTTSGAYLVIADALGQTVDQRMVDDTAMIDLSHLSSGVYVYQLIDSNGTKIANGRWVKN